MSRDIQDYYAQRAPEYDLVYEREERRPDRLLVRQVLVDAVAGRDVLELACGTGYWTPILADAARSIVATDINEEVLDIARARVAGRSNVTVCLGDAYAPDVSGEFNAAVAAFWFSHVPRSRWGHFLSGLHGRLLPGSVVVLIDNNYVEGSSNPLAEYVDTEGNTYSQRRLQDGSRFEIVKNFPTEAELRDLLDGQASDIVYRSCQYYWWLSYRIPGGGEQ